jgi:hypothetical protein
LALTGEGLLMEALHSIVARCDSRSRCFFALPCTKFLSWYADVSHNGNRIFDACAGVTRNPDSGRFGFDENERPKP